MADIYYYSYWEGVTRINHNSRQRVTYGSISGPTDYFTQNFNVGLVANRAYWGATLFTDGAVIGALTSGLTPVFAPGPALTDTYYLYDR
ncbi:MAG: hypothetical protein H7144_05200 [Burkholderiales bacterium]|nr:hypothetical protein [Phycisphaerae bacterium]